MGVYTIILESSETSQAIEDILAEFNLKYKIYWESELTNLTINTPPKNKSSWLARYEVTCDSNNNRHLLAIYILDSFLSKVDFLTRIYER